MSKCQGLVVVISAVLGAVLDSHGRRSAPLGDVCCWESKHITFRSGPALAVSFLTPRFHLSLELTLGLPCRDMAH